MKNLVSVEKAAVCQIMQELDWKSVAANLRMMNPNWNFWFKLSSVWYNGEYEPFPSLSGSGAGILLELMEF